MKIKKVLFNVVEFIRGLFSGLGLRKIKFINGFYHFLFSRLKPDFVEVGGKKIYFDKFDNSRILNPEFRERALIDIMRREVKKGDIVVDLGANIGFYTLFLADLVGPNGKVFAFEASPETFSILKKNIEANNCENVVLEKKCIADKGGFEKFFIYNDLGSHFSSLSGDLYKAEKKIVSVEVTTISLDEYFKNNPSRIDLIKMDIEGAENLALEGMKNIILKNKNVKIITEYAPIALKKVSGVRPEQYLINLKELGFNLSEIDNETLKPVNLKEITDRLTPENEECSGTNIFCFK
ncbi:MAG: FkbM family methyltransferase [Candidatus Pacebacteria bacterium]|nr:FkbM family methyltransferase [Candidatus Paceibacterota bacterium]